MVTKLSEYEKALFAKAVSAVFGEARVSRKMSQKVLAEKVGIASRTTICQVENRHRNFKYEVAAKVAKVLKIEIDLKKAPKLIASNPVHADVFVKLPPTSMTGSMYGRAPVAAAKMPVDITPAEASSLAKVEEPPTATVEVEVEEEDSEDDEEEDTEYVDDDVEDDDETEY